MAKNLISKYVWVVDTIHRAGKISFEELNRRWLCILNKLNECGTNTMKIYERLCSRRF